MDIFELYVLLADWAGWPVVTVVLILAGGFGYWVMNNRIEILKEKADFLNLRLTEAENYSPDVLLERYVRRLKRTNEEFSILEAGEERNEQRITELETEREKIHEEMGKIISKVFSAVDSLQGYDCLYCFSTENYGVEIPVELVGKEFSIDMNTMCYACGRRNTEIKVDETS